MSDDTTGWGWYDDMIYDASPEGQIERLTAERDAARAAAKAWKASAKMWRDDALESWGMFAKRDQYDDEGENIRTAYRVVEKTWTAYLKARANSR